ncbi:MAG: hypothetical protein J2P27_14865 [Actinobacteria bacterium]|nr:hypothetical protein [Actinomycetota bacterium]
MTGSQFAGGRMVRAGTGILGTLTNAMRMAKKTGVDSAGTDLVLVESLRRLAPTQHHAGLADRGVRNAMRAGLPTLVEEEADSTPVAAVDDALTLEAAGALSEAAWAANSRDTGGDIYQATKARPRWSRAVLIAVHSALRVAGAKGAGSSRSDPSAYRSAA